MTQASTIGYPLLKESKLSQIKPKSLEIFSKLEESHTSFIKTFGSYKSFLWIQTN